MKWVQFLEGKQTITNFQASNCNKPFCRHKLLGICNFQYGNTSTRQQNLSRVNHDHDNH